MGKPRWKRRGPSTHFKTPTTTWEIIQPDGILVRVKRPPTRDTNVFLGTSVLDRNYVVASRCPPRRLIHRHSDRFLPEAKQHWHLQLLLTHVLPQRLLRPSI